MSTLHFDRIYKQANTVGGFMRKDVDKKRGFIRHIIVKAASSGTDFDFYIDDGSGIKLYERTSVDDELRLTVGTANASVVVVYE